MNQKRCRWFQVGHSVCGRPATHVHYIAKRDDEEFYFCAYHAGVARRDGWKPVYRIPVT